ncbi:MAG: carboxypeptidase regulatory-like domain-containing protein, partial [Myxococcales bacterium]
PRAIFASANGYVTKGQPLAVSDDDVTLRLQPGGVVRGRVLDAQRRPLVAAVFAVTNGEPHQARTGPDGTYELKGLPQGRFVVRAHARGTPGAAPPSFTPQEVEVGPLADVTIDLVARSGGGSLRVRAVAETVTPVVLVPGDAALPQKTDDLPALFMRAERGVNEGDEWVFHHLPPGTYSVFVTQSVERGLRMHRELVRITDEAARSLQVALPNTAHVIRFEPHE